MLASTGKRALFLLDNLNEIFNSITDKQELHVLRAFLMEDSRVMIIGASASYFSKVYNVDQPFFDFFRIFTLERFNREKMDQVLRIMAERRKDATVLEILEKEPGRVQSLRILTGGNPRLVKYVYRLLHEGAFGSARHDLERLLDDCTPYFKHRIETLTTQPRRVFDAIARRWDPVGVGDLTVVLRKPSNHISAQIKRLVREGFAEETGGSDKKKLYQVAERFYNVFYLMRYSRTGRQRLEWMAGFMRVFYTLEDYQKWADKILLKMKNRNDEALEESIQGLTLDPDSSHARYVFKEACPADNPAPWLRSLPSLLAHLKNHPQNEELYQFALDGLIQLVNLGEEEAVQNLVEDNQVQEAFEPLLLAVKARTDEKILETLAPERRTLVKDVMEKLV